VGLLPQSGQGAPDLEEHFLIEIVLIRGTPGVNTADLQKPRPMIGDPLQKSGVVAVRCGVQVDPI
jgi:hypothetical protein